MDMTGHSGPAGADPHRTCPFCSHTEELTAAVSKAKLWRDAQPEDSPQWMEFQERIAALTAELLRTEANAPRAAGVNREVAVARGSVRDARNYAEYEAGRWVRPAGIGLGVGVLLVLISVVFPVPVLVWIIGILLILAGTAGLVLAVRSRHLAQDDLDDEQDELDHLEEDLAALIPTPLPQPSG